MQDALEQSYRKAFDAIDKQQYADAYQYIAEKPCAEHLQFGQWLMQKQQPLVAGQWYQYLISQDFKEPQLYYWCGVCYSAAGQHPQAEHFLNQAINTDSNSELPYVALAQMYQAQHNMAKANAILQQMLQQFPDNLQLWIQSGALFLDSQNYQIAAEYFKKIIKQWPNEAMPYNDLASCYQYLGEFEQSQKMYTRALQLDPNISGAYLGLATAKKYLEDDQHIISQLEKAQQLTNNPEVDACYHFAKAKIYDDMQKYKEAWQQAVKANKICKNHQSPYSSIEWQQNIERIIQNFPNLNETKIANTTTPIPIFIIGMPRSGTTLLEKLLSGFNDVGIAGELDGFDHILQSLVGTEVPGIYYPKQIRTISAQQKQQLRDYYLELLCAKAHPRCRWIVDKNPLNFIHLGLIQWLFPEALFIHNKRQPMDILLSNYFQFFAHPNLAYSFSIADIISFINGYQQLMRHWLRLSATTHLQLLEIEYSEVVANTKACINTLKQFLGSEQHLEANQQKIITTASIWQARQPIYSSSLDRWKNYQSELEPFIKNLDGWVL